MKRLDSRVRAMWKTFLSSIGLLTFALLAAMYSSSAARDGRFASGVISAVIALGIAVWASIRLVPRLAANVDWDWLPFFSHYQVTREGWIYFGAVTVVILSCVNTSNNLLYMVLSALLAVLLLSGFLSGLNFRLLKIEARVPDTCFAGEPFPMTLQVRNQKNVFPSFSLQLQTPKNDVFGLPGFYVPVVRGKSQELQSGHATIPRRGRHVLNKIQATSRYPFGFFVKDKMYNTNAECVCYPQIIPQDSIDFSVLDILGVNQRFERGLGYDLYTIRDYVPSDSARSVHWKASAKTAALKTREYAAEESRRVVLAFDRFGRSEQAEKFEDLVTYAASLAYHLINQGIEVELISDDWQTGYGASQSVLESILRYLALVQMSDVAAAPVTDRIDGTVRLSLR